MIEGKFFFCGDCNFSVVEEGEAVSTVRQCPNCDKEMKIVPCDECDLDAKVKISNGYYCIKHMHGSHHV